MLLQYKKSEKKNAKNLRRTYFKSLQYQNICLEMINAMFAVLELDHCSLVDLPQAIPW